ncbi:two-component system OmpR family response regulator [Arthrobacter sp. PL16]|nr:two-component system OmpR family response regulator [Arthrobacter sp. PL16]
MRNTGQVREQDTTQDTKRHEQDTKDTTMADASHHSLTDNLPRLAHPDGSPIRALVVDDETSLAELVSMGLRMAGWSVTTASDGLTAVSAARDFRPDVLVLDVMMPGVDGIEALKKIRTFAPNVPALFLTAKDAVQDRISGLSAGGDDYVTKPFSMEELMLRLHRLVQRSGVAASDSAELVVGDLVMNVDTREVTRGGEDIALTPTQWELLRYLMENPRRVVSKSQILDNVWKYDFGGQANIVELYISYLRKKIDVGRPAMIHTIRGAGYVLKPAAP